MTLARHLPLASRRRMPRRQRSHRPASRTSVGHTCYRFPCPFLPPAERGSFEVYPSASLSSTIRARSSRVNRSSLDCRTVPSMVKVTIDERDLALAREHPRGTERRTLLPYREALNDVAAYARLGERDRDVIVRWAEVRRRLAETHELDHDPANLADPLLPYARLRAHVVAGECRAAGRSSCDDRVHEVRGRAGLVPVLRHGLLAGGVADERLEHGRGEPRRSKGGERDATRRGPGCRRSQCERLAQLQPARDEQHDREDDPVDRERLDRDRPAEEGVRPGDGVRGEARAVRERREDKNDGRPRREAPAVMCQAVAGCARSGARSSSARSISSSVLK